MSTAGVLIIGNEVLSGKVEEKNARYLIGALRELGVELRRVVFIRDDIDTIARDVHDLSTQFDHVFTSGGIGSTHDDVTLAAVAKAFDAPLKTHQFVLDLLEGHYGDRMNEAVRRMAYLPEGTELLGLNEIPYPIIRFRNVYVFPGVPRFLRMKFEFLKDQLRSDRGFVLRQLFLNVSEDRIALPLAEEDAKFPDVEFGSYPQFEDEDHRTRITIEGRDPSEVQAAFDALTRRLPSEWVVRVD